MATYHQHQSMATYHQHRWWVLPKNEDVIISRTANVTPDKVVSNYTVALSAPSQITPCTWYLSVTFRYRLNSGIYDYSHTQGNDGDDDGHDDNDDDYDWQLDDDWQLHDDRLSDDVWQSDVDDYDYSQPCSFIRAEIGTDEIILCNVQDYDLSMIPSFRLPNGALRAISKDLAHLTQNLEIAPRVIPS